MGENHVKVLATLVDDGGETDDLGTCADNDDQLYFAVVFKLNI